MDEIVFGSGSMRCRASAAAIGPGPGTTQQLAVDNSEIQSMRAAVGQMHQVGTASVAS